MSFLKESSKTGIELHRSALNIKEEYIALSDSFNSRKKSMCVISTMTKLKPQSSAKGCRIDSNFLNHTSTKLSQMIV